MTDVSYGPRRLERTAAGWLLQMSGYTQARGVASHLWPYGTPSGVTVTVVTEPGHVGEFEITGLTQAGVEAMEASLGAWFMQQTVLITDGPQPAHDHGAMTVAEFASAFAEHGTHVALSGEVASVATLIEMCADVLAPLGAGLSGERARGSCFGMIWQATGHSDQEATYNEQDLYAKSPWDSWDDMRNAFHEGVTQGRAKAGQPQVYSRLAAAIGWQMAHGGLDIDGAANLVLTEIWQQLTGATGYQFVDYP